MPPPLLTSSPIFLQPTNTPLYFLAFALLRLSANHDHHYAKPCTLVLLSSLSVRSKFFFPFPQHGILHLFVDLNDISAHLDVDIDSMPKLLYTLVCLFYHLLHFPSLLAPLSFHLAP